MECGLELKEEGGPFLSLGTSDRQRSLDEPCAAASWDTCQVRPAPGGGDVGLALPSSRPPSLSASCCGFLSGRTVLPQPSRRPL